MKDRITIAIKRELLSTIDLQAKKEGRSRSNMIEMLLYAQIKDEDLTSHGDSSRTDKTEV